MVSTAGSYEFRSMNSFKLPHVQSFLIISCFQTSAEHTPDALFHGSLSPLSHPMQLNMQPTLALKTPVPFHLDSAGLSPT